MSERSNVLADLADLVAERLRSRPTTVPRVALTRAEAAAALGVSEDTFGRHVLPELRTIRPGGYGRGRLVLIPVAELQAWVDRNASLPLA